ncbi:MAG: dicarboxylate/amino acid:cation symporter [Usitatibacteraceae bacterium]
MRRWFAIPLWLRVIAAMVLGIALGLAMGENAGAMRWIGDLFIRAIGMLVVPLIFFSLVAGVAALGDIAKLGRVGGRALLLFLVTGQIAAWLGIALGVLFEPGVGVAAGAQSAPARAEAISVAETIVRLVPENPVKTMAEGEILPLIVFSLLLGVCILLAGREGRRAALFFDTGALLMQKMTFLVMELTPFGVFALMAWVAGTFGIDGLVPLASLVGLVYFGCLVVLFGVYGILVTALGRGSLLAFYRGITDVMAVSFSTSSSSATLPVTLQCTQRNLGVSRSVASFVVTLGATINMSGTAVYLGVVTLFGAQIYDIALGPAQYVMIATLSTLGAVGAAGIPGAGIIMMALVFGAIGVPLEVIALVAGVDRLMDMIRTTTNVAGDAAVALVVAKQTGELDVIELESADDV